MPAGGNDDSDFRELHTAREFSEDDEEETTSQDWGTPRELTFSYIAFDGVVGSGARRDSAVRRPRPQGRSVSEPRDLPSQPGLGDSLESIPSLSQSPEPGRRGDPDTAPPAERSLEDLGLQLDQLGWAARRAGSGEDSATSSSTPLEDEEPDGSDSGEAGKGEMLEVLGPKPQGAGGRSFLRAPPRRKLIPCLSNTPELDLPLGLSQSSPPEVLTPQPSPGCGIPQAQTPSPSRSRDSNSWPHDPSLDPKEEELCGQLEREPIVGQCFDSMDQSESPLEPHLLGNLCEELLWHSARVGGLELKGTNLAKEQSGEGRRCCYWALTPSFKKVLPLSKIASGSVHIVLPPALRS